MEAFASTEANPITDSLALQAVELVFKYLPRAYENGNDLEAREKMMFAQICAGLAFNNTGLGYVHSMAHQLGGFYNQTHGFYNAVLLPFVFEFNSVSMPKRRILQLCKAMGTITRNSSHAVDIIIDSIKKLSSAIGIQGGLKEMGLIEGDIETLSQNALKDICSLTNPRQALLEDIKGIYKAAY